MLNQIDAPRRLTVSFCFMHVCCIMDHGSFCSMDIFAFCLSHLFYPVTSPHVGYPQHDSNESDRKNELFG